MALAAADAFPDAVAGIEHRSGPVTHVESVLFEIDRSPVMKQFPAATLKLLDIAIDRRQQFYKPDLALAAVTCSALTSGFASVNP